MNGNVVPGLCADDDNLIDDNRNQTLEFPSFNGTIKIPLAQSHGKYASFKKNFECLGTIDKGSFGDTYKGRDKISREFFALKQYNFNLQDGVPSTFIKEIEILKLLKHPNVISYHGTVIGEQLNSNFQVLDLWECSLEDLLERDVSKMYAYSRDVIKCVMKQLFEGLKYIHKNLIIHRNINCKNLLFTATGVLKIAGFSGSRSYNQPLSNGSQTFDAPPSEITGNMTPTVNDVIYRAPELLFGVKDYNFSVDMWSAGCIFARLLLKKHLFSGNSEMEVFESIQSVLGVPSEAVWPGFSQIFPLWNIQNGPLTNSTVINPQSANELIRRLVIYYPKARCSSSYCLKSNYFKERPHACSLEVLSSILKNF